MSHLHPVIWYTLDNKKRIFRVIVKVILSLASELWTMVTMAGVGLGAAYNGWTELKR